MQSYFYRVTEPTIPATLYIIGIRNNTHDRTISDIQLTYEADEEFASGLRAMPLRVPHQIHPGVTEEIDMFTLFGMDGNFSFSSTDPIGKIKHEIRTFTIRVSGLDAKETSAVFEYDPGKSPPLNLLS